MQFICIDGTTSVLNLMQRMYVTQNTKNVNFGVISLQYVTNQGSSW